MFEGKHIHFSPIDNKPLCSYSKKICKQRRLNGYAFCIRHILEDGSAPFKQCSFVAKFKKCTNPIPSHEERGYCNSHMQVAGMLPKKVRRPSKKEKSVKAADKEEASRIWKSSNISCAPGHTTIILPTSLSTDVGKLKFSDRLKALLKTGSSGINLDEEAEEAMIEMDEEGIDEDDEGDSAADQMDYDPYAFSEPEPFGKVMNFGDSSRLKSSSDNVKLSNTMVQQCRVTPASIVSRKLKPVKHRSLDGGSNGHRPIVPAAVRSSLSIPLGHSESISVSGEASSETMNRLAAKIAADKVLGKHHRKFRPPMSKRSEEASVSSPSHSSSSSSSSPHHKTSSTSEPPPLHHMSRARPLVLHTARPASQPNSASAGHSRQNAQPVVHRRPSNTALGAVVPSGPARRLPFHGANSSSSPPSAVSSMTPAAKSPPVKSPTRILSLSSSVPQLVSLSTTTSSSSAAQRKERSLLEEQLLGVKGAAAVLRSGQTGSEHSSPRRHSSGKSTEVSQTPRGSRLKVDLPPPPSPGSPTPTVSTPKRSRAGHRPITYRAPSNKPHPSPAHPVGGAPAEAPSQANSSPSVVTIPSRRCRGGRGAVSLDKVFSTEPLRHVQEVWEDMRLYKQDLYPLGLESSSTEDTDSEPECGFYQRHWFTPPFNHHTSSSLRLSPNLHSSHHSRHDLKPRAKVKALLARTSSSSESRCLEERKHYSNHPASLADVGARGVAYDEWKASGFGKIPCPVDSIKGSRSDENSRLSEESPKQPISLRDQRLLRLREDLRRRCGQIGGACSLLGQSRRKMDSKFEEGPPKPEIGVKVKVEVGVDENLPVEGEEWQERMVRAVIAAARRSGPNRTGALLRDGLRLSGKKNKYRPHTRHRNRSKLTMLVARTCAYRSGDTGDSEGYESGEEGRKKAGTSTKTNGYCGSPALPCTRHCPRHVMYNVDQLLFEHCTAKFADNTQCCAPVFDVSRDTPLCPEHARKRDNYDRMCAEVKPKRARKKAKPSAMTRPSKRGKKKRRSASVPAASVDLEDQVVKGETERPHYLSPMSVLARRNEIGKSTSLSPSRRELLGEDDGSKESSNSVSALLAGVMNTPTSRHKVEEEEEAEQGDLDEDEEVASALSGACPDEEEDEEDDEDDEEGDMEEATLAAAAESLAGVDEGEEVEEECVDGVVEEEAIASVLGVGGRNRVVVEEEVDGLPLLDPSEELGNQASRLLEEHILTNVLNQIPPEAFNDLFIEGKNGEYEPTREETEELERALEAVDNDVKSLEKLSQQGGGDGNSGSGVVVVGGGPIVGATEVVGTAGGSATAGLDLDSILDEHTLHQIAHSGGHSGAGVGSGVVGIPLSQMVVSSQGRIPSSSMCNTIPSMAGLPGGSSIVENGGIGSVPMLDGGGGVPGLVPGMHVVNGSASEGGIPPLYCSQTSQGAALSAVHPPIYNLLHHAAHLDASVGQMAPVAGPGVFVTTIQTTHSAPTPSPSTPSVLAFNGGDGVLQTQAGSMASSFAPSQLAYATTAGYPNGYIVDNNPIPPSQLVSVHHKHHLLQQQNHFVPMNQVPQSFEHYIGGNHMAVEVEVATGMKRQQDHQVVAGPVDTLDLFGNGGIVDAASLFASPTPGMVAPPTGIATTGSHASPSGTHLTSHQHQMLMLAAAAAESEVTGTDTGS